MAHITGHVEAQEPTLKLIPTDKQMTDVLGSANASDVIESAVYDYPRTDAKSFERMLSEESFNLDGDAALFWSGVPIGDYHKYVSIFNIDKPIGYKDGNEPIFLGENSTEPLSNADKLTEIYNIITYNRDIIHDKQSGEAVTAYRDTEGKAWTWTDDGTGTKYTIDFTKEEDVGGVKNFFGKWLPWVDSRKEIKNRKRIEKELEKLGLSKETAVSLREQLKESHWYVADRTDKEKGLIKGKVGYHEEARDLSYFIPDPVEDEWNPLSNKTLKFQVQQIFGNMMDDFPSMVLSGYSWLSKEYQTGDMAPKAHLMEPKKHVNMFGMDINKLREGIIDFPSEDELLKDSDQYQEDIAEYALQAQKELEFTTELVEYFDEKKHTERMWASFKNLHRNIVYNNTGFELSEKMMKNLENPTDSFLYHATDVITEGLPYIAVIEGVILGYGLRGTMIANEATDYVLANTGQGLKHANPIHAINYYLKKYVTDSKIKGKPSKFIQKTMTRLEERQTVAGGQYGLKKLRVNLQKEIDSMTKRINEAKAKGDTKLVEQLTIGKNSLIRNQLDLKPRYWTIGQKSLFKNELFASIFGGVGRDIFGDGFVAAGFEISGALVEPFVFSQGLGATAKFTAIHTARLLDNISFVPKIENITDYLRAKSLNLKVEDLTIVDSVTGVPRKLTNTEVRSVRKLLGVMDKLSVNQRLEVLATMNTADEALETLMKGLPEDSRNEITFTISQYTGLAALQAVGDMYRHGAITGAFSPQDLIKVNEQMGESKNIMTLVSDRLSSLLEKHPNNSQLQNFADKINDNIRLISEDILAKEQEFSNALEVMVDLEKGVNLFNNPDMMNKNLDELYNMLVKIKEDGFDDAAKETATKLLNDFDKKLLDDLEQIAESLGTDGSTYKSNGFAGILMGIKEADRVAYRNAYTALYDVDKNFKVDFTEYFENMMSGLFPEGRFGKLKQATGVWSKRLPTTSETGQFIKVVDSATTRATGDYIKNFGNRKSLNEVWNQLADDSDEALAITSILNRKRNLTNDEMTQVFSGLKSFLKETNPAFNDIPANAITGMDIRDMILGMSKDANIPIRLNLREAMEFKSGIGAIAYGAIKAENTPKVGTFTDMHETISTNILDTINKSGNDELVENFAIANNSFLNYIHKYNSKRFKDIKKWVTTDDTGTQYKVSQDKSGNSKKQVEKVKSVDQYTTNIYKEITGDDSHKITRFVTTTNASEWIKYDKLLNDKAYADNFMQNVIRPLVGVRDPSQVITSPEDAINYIVDLNNPQTIQKLKIVRGFLKDGLGDWFRRSPQGELVIGPNNTKKILAEDKINVYTTEKVDKVTKINIDNNAKHWFKITGADGKHIDILQIDNVVNSNLSFENLLARNKFVADLTLDNQRGFSKQYKKAKQKVQREILDFKNDLKLLDDRSIIFNFGQKLSDPKVFVNEIIKGNGTLKGYNKLKNVLVGEGPNQMSLEKFNTLTKEMFAEYFFKTYSRPDLAKPGVKYVGEKPLLEIRAAYNFTENAVGAKEFIQVNKKNLIEIFGSDHMDDLDGVLNFVLLKNGVSDMGIQSARLPKSLSIESLMSRLYSINRGIISPNYVATEIAVTRFRKNRGNLMKAIIEEPELAKIIRKVLESDDIYKDPLTNDILQKLLNKTVIKAILLRESLQINVEGIDGPLGFDIDSEEERQENMLNEMNQEMYKIKDRL
ncbi:hypothetical protein CMI37_19745 [Candidatus Pacearchaeota archaeon]|nr:hypothetical protein [Candidatus Pacearchaeota archaeon]|tara:strand:- start:53 stop:5143 length:5091 start_codon:yes stop_codon:yes gene_type:complete